MIFSPHPSSRKTTNETVRLMRAALKDLGVPEDVLQCVEQPSIPLANELMSICDLTIATGGPAMVKAAYGSGKPAYGVGAGNATMVIDETADIDEAARNTVISKTNDHGSGCSADGNLVVDAGIYDALLRRAAAAGRLPGQRARRRQQLARAYWDEEGRRTGDTIARPASAVAAKAGFAIPADKTFFLVEETHIGKQHPYSTEKLGVVLAVFKYRRLRRRPRQGAADLRDRRPRPLVRHLLVQRRPHQPPRADGAGEPHHGAAGAVQLQRRHVHQRHADDVEHGLRRVGRQHHQREHLAQALHERDLGEPADCRRQALRSRAVRRVLQRADQLRVAKTLRRGKPEDLCIRPPVKPP